MNRWRFPSISFHGIQVCVWTWHNAILIYFPFQGAFSGQGEKTVIPSAVTGK